jgi:hypothetical protein
MAAQVHVAGVLVLDVADDIRFRLGEPTVTALARRFGSAGQCLTCGRKLGTEPLSVRAYHAPQGTVTLVAYHAGCAASAWVDVGPAPLPRQDTWAAAVTSLYLPPAGYRWFRRPGRRRMQGQLMPIMLVHPSLEMTRARQAGVGEAVNADVEGYSRLGFADPGPLARASHLRPTGRAWAQTAGAATSLHVVVADRAWSAPIQRRAAALATARGGVLVGIICDHDPAQLAAETTGLEHAIDHGEVLIGWAPLAGGRGGHRRPGRFR